MNTKAKPYGSHRFALCFENMTGMSGWVTEKIFDCFILDTVPVYWGANDIQEHVPTQSFIDYREYPSPEQLHDQLVEMERSEYRRMRAAGKEFVYQCDIFKPEFYASKLLKLTNNILNSSQKSTISERRSAD